MKLFLVLFFSKSFYDLPRCEFNHWKWNYHVAVHNFILIYYSRLLGEFCEASANFLIKFFEISQ